MLLSLRKNGLTSSFEEVRVFKEIDGEGASGLLGEGPGVSKMSLALEQPGLAPVQP